LVWNPFLWPWPTKALCDVALPLSMASSFITLHYHIVSFPFLELAKLVPTLRSLYLLLLPRTLSLPCSHFYNTSQWLKLSFYLFAYLLPLPPPQHFLGQEQSILFIPVFPEDNKCSISTYWINELEFITICHYFCPFMDSHNVLFLSILSLP
jgi:hypothetical protein